MLLLSYNLLDVTPVNKLKKKSCDYCNAFRHGALPERTCANDMLTCKYYSLPELFSIIMNGTHKRIRLLSLDYRKFSFV